MKPHDDARLHDALIRRALGDLTASERVSDEAPNDYDLAAAAIYLALESKRQAPLPTTLRERLEREARNVISPTTD